MDGPCPPVMIQDSCEDRFRAEVWLISFCLKMIPQRLFEMIWDLELEGAELQGKSKPTQAFLFDAKSTFLHFAILC